jgi:excisionase family DNA binding protein
MTIRYLTAGEAARLLGVKPGTLLSYVRRKKIRARKVNASTNLYRADDVATLAANPPRPGRPPKDEALRRQAGQEGE